MMDTATAPPTTPAMMGVFEGPDERAGDGIGLWVWCDVEDVVSVEKLAGVEEAEDEREDEVVEVAISCIDRVA